MRGPAGPILLRDGGLASAPAVKLFRVRGRFRLDGRWQRFERELRGLLKLHVLERIYSELGSRHRVKRSLIRIEQVEELEVRG